MKLFTLKSITWIVASLFMATVNAQSLNHTAMEELFGEPVTTSATGKPQRVSEAPMTMEIITAEDIRRSGAVDVAEVLRQVNGLNVVQKSEQQYDASVRGYNHHFSQRLLVLLNGRQLYLDYDGFTNWAVIPVQLQEILQIEIIKGPNTALFGFNAVSGVINIVTYNPLYDEKSSGGITLGTQNFRQGYYVQSFKPVDNFGLRLSGGIRRFHASGNPANSTVAITDGNGDLIFTDPEAESVNVDALYQVTEKSQLRFALSGANSLQGQVVPNGSAFRERHETRSLKLTYELDSDLGLIKANIYKNYMDLVSIAAGSTAAPSSENSVLVAQLEDILSLTPKHTIRIHGEFRDNVLTSTAFMPAGAEIGYKVHAASGMWEWDIRENLTWINAIRVDLLSLERSGPFTGTPPYSNADYARRLTQSSYNSGLVWMLTSADTLRLNSARGLQLPSLFEFGANFMGGPFLILGEPSLDPAAVTSHELAWDHQLTSLNGKFRLALFHQKTKDVLTYRAQNIAGLVLTRNIGDSKMSGLELSLKGKAHDKFEWGIGYTYLDIDDSLSNGKTDVSIVSPREYEDGNPTHEVKLKLGYQSGPWEADFLAYYTSGTKAIGYVLPFNVLEDIDAYVGINGRIAYTFGNGLTMALQGQQLQQNQVQTSVGPDIERRIFLSVNKNF